MNDPTLFLVRVWQHATGARASVRAADVEQPQLFTAAQPLGDFLLGAATAPRGAEAAASAACPDANAAPSTAARSAP